MTTIPTENEQQMLLERSVPIWPTQLWLYTEMSSLVPQHCDYSMPMMQIEPASNDLTAASTGEECTHTSGATYHYNAKMASRLKIDDEQWLMVIEPISMRGEEECAMASHWNDKRLELEAQFWKHVEYFPRRIDMSLLEVRMLRHQLNWYRVGEFFEVLMLEDSTAASIFWTLDQMKEMAAELAIAEELAGPDEIVKESGIAICGHHKYLNHHGQPEARLMRTHSLGEKCGGIENSPFMTGVAFAMFWIPIMVFKCLRNIYVDGLINRVDIRGFTDSYNAQAKAQTTVASVILAVDASILAIPGLGAQVATKTSCSISFVLNVLPTRENARHRDHQSKILDHRSSGTSNDVTGHKVISVLCAVLLPGACASSAWVVLQEFLNYMAFVTRIYCWRISQYT
ncbi:hypothetical protein C8R48DRAFT_678331 [Suillus tomentosus]|nr:hypothetical protein C8R48DRAFT_678331 [Suillus tomentosus]